MSNVPPGIVLLAGAVALPLVPPRWRGASFLLFPALAFALLLWGLETGTTTHLSFLNYDLVVNRVDRLSMAFGWVFVIMAFVGGLYAYHLRDLGQQMAALTYAGAALGVVFAGDLLTLVVFWEIMGLASLYLILARRTERSGRAGMRYLAWHLTGGAVLLAGVLWQIARTDSLLFNGIEWSGPGILILLGFALNAAVPPLHAWLPDAYPEGTVTGSVFLSAFTTKTAVYALARGFAGWEVLAIAGTVMAVYGVVFAILANDIRRLLAYHIVSQVGYMVAGVGIGTAVALNGATAHAFAHILYKGLLFMGAGTVLYATGTSKLTQLGGLARLMPATLVLYMVGAFSISGVPLFSGFVSKSMVVFAASEDHRQLIALFLNLASVGTFLSVGLKLPYFTWFGHGRAPQPRPIPKGMYAGMVAASALSILFGVYPALLYNLLPFPVEYVPYTGEHLTETMQLLLATALGFVILLPVLKPHAARVLDTDWLPRTLAHPAYLIAVVAPAALFGRVEELAVRWVAALSRWVANPVGYFPSLPSLLGIEAHPETDPSPANNSRRFDPDRYRGPVGMAVVVVLVVFVLLGLWSLARG